MARAIKCCRHGDFVENRCAVCRLIRRTDRSRFDQNFLCTNFWCTFLCKAKTSATFKRCNNERNTLLLVVTMSKKLHFAALAKKSAPQSAPFFVWARTACEWFSVMSCHRSTQKWPPTAGPTRLSLVGRHCRLSFVEYTGRIGRGNPPNCAKPLFYEDI